MYKNLQSQLSDNSRTTGLRMNCKIKEAQNRDLHQADTEYTEQKAGLRPT